MGLFDNVKGRLGLGKQYDNDGGYDDGYDPEDYDSAEPTGVEGAYQPVNYTSRRGGYQNGHAPLVSITDVRAQTLSPQGQRARVTNTATSRRNVVESNYTSPLFDDDARSLNDALSHSDTNSLSQLHKERRRLEDSGRIGEPVVADTPEYYASRSGTVKARTASSGPRRRHEDRQVIVIRPVAYADAEQVATSLKDGDAVVIDLTKTRPEMAKRILDFSFGAASALGAKVDRNADRVFCITTESGLSNDELDLLRNRGIL